MKFRPKSNIQTAFEWDIRLITAFVTCFKIVINGVPECGLNLFWGRGDIANHVVNVKKSSVDKAIFDIHIG